ncbi:MAG: methyl-accepting chemotaxis protein [Clostridiales Family XIII bacterium]|jgi:methyl-accepting chemotaxis protein|nr:methyl-accepting chemotaxis protein [Clostridiales Family XIII bacterium]
MNKRHSIKFKITSSTILCFVAGMLIILLTLFFYLRYAFDSIAEDTAKKQGEKYANMIKAHFENPLSFLAGITGIVEEQIAENSVDRIGLQKRMLHTFENYGIAEGMALMMEPNVYDGLDGTYVGTDYGTDRSGRISFYYYLEDGQARYRAQVDEDDKEFTQAYYVGAKEKKAPAFTDPYMYSVGDRKVNMISASEPIMGKNGNIAGVAVIDIHMDDIHSVMSAEKIYDTGYMVVTNKSGKVLYSPIPEDMGRSAEEAGILYDRPASGEDVSHSRVKSVMNGKKSIVATVPVTLNRADDTFYVSIVAPEDEINAVYIKLLWLMLAIFAAAGALIAIVINITVGRTVRPLHLMMGLLKQVGETGNLTFTDEEWQKIRAAAARKDEIGMSVSAFMQMLQQFVYYGESLQSIANHDLTVDVKALGAEDTMGVALREMAANLNDMFGRINVAAHQVSAGAKQIADGAQGLASGTSEQAASVEQLSASITEISRSINEAASSARNAASLAADIKSKAERGSGQMDDMMKAVREINEASQNIGRVIKAIDDIAFQTNILALNAAVEAARAGQHGKGFAVVAEEVRNLAAKSAEAAKNTEALIANSIAKAELGVKIADETNGSLREIVEGIVASSRISDEIAANADMQSEAILQINTGIDQVSSVVQQNSATSEESAAASQELSAQSMTLSGLIAQFELKDFQGAEDEGRPAGLPAPREKKRDL